MSTMELKSKPWLAEFSRIPDHVDDPRGMIGPEERRAFYWLARNCLSGSGCVVDAGAFLGASTYCFAAGAHDAGAKNYRDATLVQAYDYFEVIDEYVGAAIEQDFRPISAGDSYLDIFEQQVSRYRHLITAHRGDFLSQRWNTKPIDILFVDIAKTQALNSHVIEEFFPSLVPDHSILVHQDYHHCWHPYIHISMEFLDDEFDLVDGLVQYQSRIWRLTKPIPEEKLQRLSRYDLLPAERLFLLDRLVKKSEGPSRSMLEVVRIWQICLDGDWERASYELSALNVREDPGAEDPLWERQAHEVRQHIDREIPG